MTEAAASPFLSGILSPAGGLNIGATLLSPDETPSMALFKSMQSHEIHTPAPSASKLLVSTQRAKKRQRDETSEDQHLPSDSISKKEVYRVVTGKYQLHPYVVCLVEEVIAQRSLDVLKYPLPPYLPHTEPEDRRKMRLHLRNRFLPVKEESELVDFTQRLLELWGGKLQLVPDTTPVGSRYGKNILQLVTPIRRNKGCGFDKLDDLETEELLQFDFLDDATFGDGFEATSTVEDNWTCGPTNLRRVTYHETPSTTKKQKTLADEANKENIVLQKETKKPKATNPKRGMRWTTAERKLFLQGLERWGAGNWKSIHKSIPGRTYVQVKSMGVYLVSKFQMSRGQGPSKPVTDYLLASTGGSSASSS
mmetsp:Transcript_14281/g.39680  ORF Transcript_14281/g.39680 Transcript_14281/m.39680 type:complete len:365 (-) Transcript_14281:181-1275(-)